MVFWVDKKVMLGDMCRRFQKIKSHYNVAGYHHICNCAQIKKTKMLIEAEEAVHYRAADHTDKVEVWLRPVAYVAYSRYL